MEQSYFFNDVDGDRSYNADDFAKYFRQFLSDGVYKHNAQPNLAVTSNGMDMTTTLDVGNAFIQGYMYENSEPLSLTHDAADSTLDRIDRVVLRLDKYAASRNIKSFVLKGTASSSPVAPSLQQDDFIYEISLAQVRIEAGKSFIDQAQITDERVYAQVIDEHIQNTNNPHNVTTSQIGAASLSKINTFTERQIFTKNDTTTYESADTNGQITVGATLLIQQTGGSNGAFAQIALQSRVGFPQSRVVSSGGSNPFLALVNNRIEGLRIESDGSLTVKNSVKIFTGAENPEGRITAPVGSIYLRTNSGVNSTFFVKEVGTGNTGWGAK